MLTDLSFLDSGKSFPPYQERERLEEYKKNEQLFHTKVPQPWLNHFNEIAQRLGRTRAEISTIFGYQQLISKKTADFTCGEPPTLETEQDTDAMLKLMERLEFFPKLYEAFIDISRFGNAVVKFKGKDVTAVSPMFWFPVCDPGDLKKITHHVISYPIDPDENGHMRKLYTEIHTPGMIVTRINAFNQQGIGGLIEEKAEQTGLEDFAVQVLTNVTCSSDLFGVSDYSEINNLIERLIWRFSCIDNVLDKHSAPTMSGPSDALEHDEKFGTSFLNLGKYFARDTNDSPDLHYITWDGNLDSSFKEAEMLFNQLYILSEMGQAFADAGGADSSGTALKLRLVSPRVKAARLVKLNNARVKRMICTLCQLNGINVNYDGLTLHWNDGLPVDETEQINNLTIATGGKAIMSRYSALKQRGLTDSQVEAEIDQIQAEDAAMQPLQLGVIGNE